LPPAALPLPLGGNIRQNVAGVMCLSDYSRDQTIELREEAVERVAAWE